MIPGPLSSSSSDDVLINALNLSSALSGFSSMSGGGGGGFMDLTNIPSAAQIINPASFAVLSTVLPATVKNGSTPFLPPNTTLESLRAQPFHIYHPDFLSILGPSPSLTLLAEMETDPFAHEAPIWVPETNEVFFSQNAGGKGSGTGLNQTNDIYKISISEADALAETAVTRGRDTEGLMVNLTKVAVNPQLEMVNGGTYYKGHLAFLEQGRGADLPPAVSLVNPLPPYNSTVILNNFFGRQFNSLNDIAWSPRGRELVFTDTTYGYNQGFRPPPALPQHVYGLNECTGLVRVLADGFAKCNGVAFSPDGSKAYVTDTGAADGDFGTDWTRPATVYSFDVSAEDGTFGNRKVFAFFDVGLPDGIKSDTNGNIYTGAGDGIHIHASSGVLLGKIFSGGGTANLAFAGPGRIVMLAEQKLYLVKLAADGVDLSAYDFSC